MTKTPTVPITRNPMADATSSKLLVDQNTVATRCCMCDHRGFTGTKLVTIGKFLWLHGRFVYNKKTHGAYTLPGTMPAGRLSM